MDVADTVLPLIRSTRGMLLPHYGNVEVIARKSLSPHDAVTQLDHDVERFLSAELKKLYPEAAFAGEEFGGDRTAERFWLCDPIDGTAHFIRGLPFCTVMLALVENGQVTFSAIYDFVGDNMYHAVLGKGAFHNGTPMQVSTRPAGDSYLFWETHANVPKNNDIFLKLREKAVLMKMLCAGYEYVMVALGKIEGRVTFDPWGHDWDFAPGSLLVSEAGGIVANLGVHTFDYRNLDFIAASPATYEMLTNGPDAIFPVRPQL